MFEELFTESAMIVAAEATYHHLGTEHLIGLAREERDCRRHSIWRESRNWTSEGDVKHPCRGGSFLPQENIPWIPQLSACARRDRDANGPKQAASADLVPVRLRQVRRRPDSARNPTQMAKQAKWTQWC